MEKRTLVQLAGIAALVMASSQSLLAQQYAPTVMEYLQKDGRFGTFLHLAKSSGVDSWFRTYPTTGVTVLAPTDTAFSRVPVSVMAYLSKNPEALTKVIEFHIVPREKTSSEIKLAPKTVEGDLLNLTGGVPPRTASFIGSEVDADNGRIQVIDQVLFPPSVFVSLQREGDFPVAVGLGFHKKMTGAGIVHDVPIRTTAQNRKATRPRRGHWGRVPGTYGRVWIPG